MATLRVEGPPVHPSSDLERTISRLSTLPQASQVDALLRTREVQSSIQQHGLTTMTAVVKSELSKKREQKAALLRERLQTLHRIRRTFKLHHTGHENVDYVLPLVSVYDGILWINDVAEKRFQINPRERTIQWSRDLLNGLYEHGQVVMCDHEFSGQGAILLSHSDSTTKTSKGATDNYIPFRAIKTGGIQDAPFDDPDQYSMILDRDVWPITTPTKTIPTDPTPFGIIIYDTENTNATDPAYGLSVRVIRVPLLDQLCAIINKTFQAQGTETLETLYTSTVDMMDKPVGDISTADVELTYASLIWRLADKESLGGPLTFRDNLNSDIILPILFSKFEIQIQANTVIGSLYEYSPEFRGCLGDRQIRNNRAEATPSSLMLTPAHITKSLGSSAIPSLDGLVTNPEYSEVAVHQTTQELVQNAMYYYMDSTQRQQLLNTTNLPNLPIELSPGYLSVDIQNWLKVTYAPAYIANMLCHVQPNVSATWGQNFTDAEKIKVQYWWTGKGRKCLSNDPIYNDLTKIAFRCAMVQVCPSLVSFRVEADAWAQRLVEAVQQPIVLRSVSRTPIIGGTNYMSKIGNIVTALSTNLENTGELFNAVYARSVVELASSPYIDVETAVSDEVTQWFEDAISFLGTQVLSDTAVSIRPLDISIELKQDLKQDIESIEQALGLSVLNKTPAERMAAIIENEKDFITAYSKMSSPLTGSTFDNANLDRDVSDPSLPDWTAGTSFLDWASVAYYIVLDRFEPKLSAATRALSLTAANDPKLLIRGILTLVMGSRNVWLAIKNITEWDTNDFIQQIIFMSAAIQSIVSAITLSMKIWVSFKTAVMGTIARISNSLAALKLSQSMQVPATAIANLFKKDPVLNIKNFGLEERVQNATLKPNGPPGAAPLESRIPTGTPKQPLIEIPEGTPAVAAQTATKFNIAIRMIADIGVVISGVMIIEMSVQLAQNWATMKDSERAVQIVQIAIAFLTIICSDTVSNAIATSLAALLPAVEFLGAALVVAAPYLAVALVVVSLIIMCVTIAIQMRKPPPPPPSPVETFISGYRSVIVGWEDQPLQLLSYLATKSSTNGFITQYTLSGMNPSTDNAVTLQGVKISFQGGVDAASLFDDTDFTVVPSTQLDRMNNGKIFLSPDEATRASLVTTLNRATPPVTSFDLQISGVTSEKNLTGMFSLRPREAFAITITGKISVIGSALVQVTEYLNSNDYSYQPLLMTKV